VGMRFQYLISHSEFPPLVEGAIPIMIECELPLPREYRFYAILSFTKVALRYRRSTGPWHSSDKTRHSSNPEGGRTDAQ